MPDSLARRGVDLTGHLTALVHSHRSLALPSRWAGGLKTGKAPGASGRWSVSPGPFLLPPSVLLPAFVSLLPLENLGEFKANVTLMKSRSCGDISLLSGKCDVAY